VHEEGKVITYKFKNEQGLSPTEIHEISDRILYNKLHHHSLNKKISFNLWFQKIIKRKFTYNFMCTNLPTVI